MTAPAVAVLALALAGCAQILGLDNTERRDAGTGTGCAVDLQCDGAADRAVCGRLVDAVSGLPFTAPAATGAACVAGATDGPCAFAVSGETADELFTGTGTPIVASMVDDCGRFRVEGLTGTTLAIVAEPVAPADLTYRRVAGTIMYNSSGTVEGIEVPVVQTALVTGWETMAPMGTAIPEGLLVLFRAGSAPSATVVAKINTVAVAVPPASPFALYFDGSSRFQTVTTTDGDGPVLRTETGASGTALVVPADTNPFNLGGARPGKNCTELNDIRRVANTLVYLELTNC